MAALDTKHPTSITPARQCSVSGKCFEEGDRVASCLFKAGETGILTRRDVLEQIGDDDSITGSVLGRWTRIFKADLDLKKFSAKQRLANAENLFISMMDSVSADNQQELQLNALKYLLALMLERKRILKHLGSINQTTVRYRYVKTKAEYNVPCSSLADSDLMQIAQRLDELLAE